MKLIRLNKGVWFLPDEIVAIIALGGEKHKDVELIKPRVQINGIRSNIMWTCDNYEDAAKAADYYAELVNAAKDKEKT
jgi:autonomous glycyl radical cofactor GrcA